MGWAGGLAFATVFPYNWPSVVDVYSSLLSLSKIQKIIINGFESAMWLYVILCVTTPYRHRARPSAVRLCRVKAVCPKANPQQQDEEKNYKKMEAVCLVALSQVQTYSKATPNTVNEKKKKRETNQKNNLQAKRTK